MQVLWYLGKSQATRLNDLSTNMGMKQRSARDCFQMLAQPIQHDEIAWQHSAENTAKFATHTATVTNELDQGVNCQDCYFR
jgi:hypothetical protein